MLAERTNLTITRRVRLLAVSRSGYYAVIGPDPLDHALRRGVIGQKVAWFHGDSDKGYEAPRILADLRAEGETISRRKVPATMRRLHRIAPTLAGCSVILGIHKSFDESL